MLVLPSSYAGFSERRDPVVGTSLTTAWASTTTSLMPQQARRSRLLSSLQPWNVMEFFDRIDIASSRLPEHMMMSGYRGIYPEGL